MFRLSPTQLAVNEALAALERGELVRERRHLDFKEEAGRRGPQGQVEPGRPRNETAIQKLAPEVACFANTPGGGALIVGVADDGQLIGTALEAEWVRARLYAKLERRITPDVDEVVCRGVRLLVIRVPEAIEPIRFEHRLRWRVDDQCVEIDPTTWHARHLESVQFDWSGQPSGVPAEAAREGAIGLVRDYLRGSGDASAQDLADARTPDLLRRLNAVSAAGELTNAAALLLVGRTEPCVDYLRREFAGGDSLDRVRRADRSLLEQLQETFLVARAHNPLVHLDEGLAVGQLRVLPERALREAIVNGIAHRDWQSPEPTIVEHIGGTLRVTSPGGFVGDVNSENLLHHPSRSRNRALTALLAELRIAEREGIGVDRMFGDMLRLGYPLPSVVETPGGSVVTTLVANEIDRGWIRWIAGIAGARAGADLRLLMSTHFLVERGWLDELVLGPFLQLPNVETRDAITTLTRLTVDGNPLVVVVTGSPSESVPAYAMGPMARRALEREDGARRRAWPTRERIALSYAEARGRISTTELASLVDATATNVGGVLTGLEQRGFLRGSRATRRGAGFHYLYVPPSERA